MTWDFSTVAHARLNNRTHIVYYSSQLIEISQELGKFEEYLSYFNEWLHI